MIGVRVCVYVLWNVESTRRKNEEAQRAVWKLPQCPRSVRSLSEHLGGRGKHAALWAQHCRKASVSILISRDAKALGRKERVA